MQLAHRLLDPTVMCRTKFTLSGHVRNCLQSQAYLQLIKTIVS